MTLAELQRTLDRTLRGELPPADAAALLGADPRRLAIYARFTRNHAHTALTENLPVFVARAADRWPALFDAYFAAHPPRHWALNHAAEGFPAYIEHLAETAPDWPGPFETCLAQFEWTLYTALADPTPIPDPITLTAPVPNPTLVPISFPYPVADVVLAHRRGEHPPTPAPLAEPAVVFFYQSPTTGNGRFQKTRPDLLFALAATTQGLDAAAAADRTGQPRAAVDAAYATAAQLGLIVTPA
ncbi:MAG: putative DNA-binding domain-containing protein [Myxococcales bacterium]|nr:putative DNA-binding domain-containing protein [Myxococcales bacterium]